MFVEDLSYALTWEKGRGLLYRLDPRSKMLYVAVVGVAAFTAQSPLTLLALLVAQLAVAHTGRLLRKVAALAKGIAPLLALIIVFDTVVTYLTMGLDVGYLAHTFTMMTLRVLTVLAAFTSFIVTTTPQQLVQALTSLGLSYVHAYPLIITYRFIPVMFSEMRNIYDAQRARGLELEKGGPLERARRLVPIVIPSIVCALLKAKELAEAMEARGFGSHPKRTYHRPLKTSRTDYLFITATTLTTITIIALEHIHPLTPI